MITTQMLEQEPGWTLERKGTESYLRRDASQLKKGQQRVCFRCDVEVREYERDEPEDYYHRANSNSYDYLYDDAGVDAEQEDNVAGNNNNNNNSGSSSPLAMCASCLAALCVTVILPWLLMSA